MIFVTQTPEMDIEAVVREVEVEIMITIEEGLETMNIVRMTGIERQMTGLERKKTVTLKEKEVRYVNSDLSAVTELLVCVYANIQILNTKLLMTDENEVAKKIIEITKITNEINQLLLTKDINDLFFFEAFKLESPSLSNQILKKRNSTSENPSEQRFLFCFVVIKFGI